MPDTASYPADPIRLLPRQSIFGENCLAQLEQCCGERSRFPYGTGRIQEPGNGHVIPPALGLFRTDFVHQFLEVIGHVFMPTRWQCTYNFLYLHLQRSEQLLALARWLVVDSDFATFHHRPPPGHEKYCRCQ